MDVTKIIAKSKPGYVFQNVKEGQIYNIGVDDAGLSGIKAIGTHELVTIPKGKALVGGNIIVLTGVKSATDAATIKIQINGEDITTAATVDQFPVGAVVSLDLTGIVSAYAASADITVDLVVAVEALTAGRFIAELDVMDIDSMTTRG